MEEMLIDCCKKMIAMLDNLLAEGKISLEEYTKQVEMKVKFLEEE